ncbi:MAG: DUF4384 domain-containing protein [Verrucomicrobiae bacterium]|nr:DUF4384 domain-containing protein [Verrucomicrobiae bacterium]
MRKVGFLAVSVFLVVVLFGALASADVLPRTTTATRDIVLVEDDEEDATAEKAAVDGEETVARLGVEEMYKTDFVLSLESGKTAEGDIYAIGDKIDFKFTSDQDCYVTLLDFTPSGKIYMLFPNKWVPNNFVKAGESITVPAAGQKFSMKVGGPAGVDVVKAIATNVETVILDPENQKLVGPFTALEDAKAATRDIILFEEEAEAPADVPLKWAAASLAVFTKGDAPEKGGFGLVLQDGWVAKAWADRDAFLTGEAIFVKLQSNRPATLVSLVNKGASGNENILLPEGVERNVVPGAITVLPGKDDKWKLIAASEPGLDTVTAVLRDEAGAEVSISFVITVEE